jgi:N-acetylglutamate synthase-like GNAT family acetyltransferase
VQPYFRDAVRGDLGAIAEILRTSAPHDARQQTATPESYRRGLEEIERHDGSYLLVAEFDQRIGAAVHMVVFPLIHGGGGRTAEIVGLWVADAFRTSGLDAMLLDHAIARADDLGCRRVHVLAAASARGKSVWERSGFIHLDAGYVRAVHDQPRLRTVS